ncbi:hypothetical protein AB0D94_08025 [Streptomyces sp. NPDC048255]|uniref:hypothetical protein n=1 Tax=Streptomyces sp. NPDC048255 TaxID=3154713 RepID=UPI0033EE512D
MTVRLLPGARWLAQQAGYARPTATHHPWSRGPLASIPIGLEFAVVRVPEAAASRVADHLAQQGAPTGPVLNLGHVRAFLVHPTLRDGRLIPGGVLLVGALGEELRCPMPGRPAKLPRFWSVPPDGSGDLLDPYRLAEALRVTWTPLPGPLAQAHADAQDEGLPADAGAVS